MTHYDTCLERILILLGPRAAQRGPITAASDLIGDLGLSSIDVMEVIEQVEDEFDISFPLNSLPDIHTVSDLARALERLAAA
jgi:acyl carrier protein